MKHDANAPWLSGQWAASPFNFDAAINVPPHPIELHDITVRDGEECAGLAFSVEDKVRIAEALVRFGVKRMELFLTVPGWLEAIRAILARGLGTDLYVTWHPGRVERALDLGVRHIMVWYRIGDVYQQHVLQRPREELMDEMRGAVRAAKASGATVNLFLPECTRATLEHILAAAKGAKEEGASAITVVDSQGSARPAAIRYLVEQVRAETGLGVEVHCHNDFGLAVANALAAYEGGATALNVSVNGIGYRAGGVALEEVVMALEVLYGVHTGLRLEMLPELSRLVEEITGIPNDYLKPIVGRGAFDYEQWGSTSAHIAGGERRYAFPFEPEAIGRSARLMIGKWSDVAAVKRKLVEFGLTASPDKLAEILVASQRAGIAHHRPLSDDEFLSIAVALGVEPCE
jgi:isopropylmalate/homocitrate/citramalate synthase